MITENNKQNGEIMEIQYLGTAAAEDGQLFSVTVISVIGQEKKEEKTFGPEHSLSSTKPY